MTRQEYLERKEALYQEHEDRYAALHKQLRNLEERHAIKLRDLYLEYNEKEEANG